MKNFRNLQVWRKAHALTLSSYRTTATFPKQEVFGLVSQIRRCAASIPANIAEGCGKRGNGEFYRFLNISAGSASELEYHVLLVNDLGYVSGVEYRTINEAVIEIKRMLAALIQKVDADRSAG